MKDRVVFPPFPPFYCARIAPLPIPMFKHLYVLAYREEEKVAKRRRLSPEQIWNNTEKEVKKARDIVYDYMNPFVQAELKKGAGHAFLTSNWLLDALKSYNPKGEKNSVAMLNNWQQKGVLRRSKFRGHYDPTSVAAILMARVVVKTLERNITPIEITADEPHWWCFSQTAPSVSALCIPVPLSADLPPAACLWTSWKGASWYSEDWSVYEDKAVRWAGPIASELPLAVWDKAQAQDIEEARQHKWCTPTVERTLIRDASQAILKDLANSLMVDDNWL